jgi:hypothetical protein
MKIRIHVQRTQITATLEDNETANDFVSLLRARAGVTQPAEWAVRVECVRWRRNWLGGGWLGLRASTAGRAGTPDKVGTVGALLMGPDGAFITGSDFLMDGGVTAAYWFGELATR